MSFVYAATLHRTAKDALAAMLYDYWTAIGSDVEGSPEAMDEAIPGWASLTLDDELAAAVVAYWVAESPWHDPEPIERRYLELEEPQPPATSLGLDFDSDERDLAGAWRECYRGVSAETAGSE